MLKSSSAIESNLFADDFIAQASLGTSDVFSSSELIGGDLLETSTFLEADADVTATEPVSDVTKPQRDARHELDVLKSLFRMKSPWASDSYGLRR